jgi:hypothetical protein
VNQMPELLSLDDEVPHRTFEEIELMMIIEDWKAGRYDALTALGLIHNRSLIGVDDQMMGLAAVSIYRVKR